MDMVFSVCSLRIELSLFDPGRAPLDLFKVTTDSGAKAGWARSRRK